MCSAVEVDVEEEEGGGCLPSVVSLAEERDGEGGDGEREHTI